MKENQSREVDAFIEALPEKNIQEITISLRHLVLETSQFMVEEIKWGMPSYRMNKSLCYLQPSKKHVNLGFYAGASFRDPYHLLGGTGKQMRHVRIKKMEDMDSQKIKGLIQEAIDQQG